MSIRKRNDFLDAEESDGGESGGYQSEEEEGRAAIGGRATKRRKVDSSDDDNDEKPEIAALPKQAVTGSQDARFDASAFDDEDGVPDHARIDDDHNDDQDADSAALSGPPKRPIPKSVARAEKAARRSGVLYISRIPPFMKPHTLKHFLLPHAPSGLGKIFLTPESHASYLARKKSGGNKKHSFTDGWVEFTSKRDAKLAAEVLNGNCIGGKKGGYYHDDLWNVKYLRGFKWGHLTEQIAAENAEREARLRDEVRKTRKENRGFLEDVERGKMEEGMEMKRRAKGGVEEGGGGEGKRTKQRPAKVFKQMKVQGSGTRSVGADEPEVRKTLSMIF
ncbi:hypothetical protein B0A48_04943 [Cryoendolithus antarcticus]|uniref:18S rRNA factor 2 n=1 Tax=Cryoendolithus antarcticus TaxID=1507870 RepID=A0A1V8TE53_9PEZI|nr:hypothetical protein B0A48_04943 [Cryoendolithus antarcticus]